MDRLDLCDLAYAVNSVFRLQKVVFLTNMSPNSVTGQAAKEVLLSLVDQYFMENIKGKAIPLQAWTGPEGSRGLRHPDFKTIGTWRW
jgi:hypothetical protein